jgi:hypothetical protein
MKVKGDSIILCCGNRGCPSIRIVDNAVQITFDDGTTSPLLSYDEVKMMPAALDKLLGDLWVKEIDA